MKSSNPRSVGRGESITGGRQRKYLMKGGPQGSIKFLLPKYSQLTCQPGESGAVGAFSAVLNAANDALARPMCRCRRPRRRSGGRCRQPANEFGTDQGRNFLYTAYC